MRAPAYALALLAGPAAAQDASRTVDELAQCRAVATDAERLRCFDGLAERIAAARRSGDLIVTDRAQVVERKRRAFGLATPNGDVFGGGPEDRATEVKRLDTTLVAAAPSAAYGRWNLQLGNGSVWQTVDTLSRPPKVGAPITVRTASLGGFRASMPGGFTAMVKRVR